MFRQSRGFKAVDEDWHRTRHKARTETFNLSEWSDQEIVRYDLETAGVTGRDNRRSYTWDRPIDSVGSNGTDLRTLDSR